VRERIDTLETALRGRLDEVDEGVHEHLDGTKDALHRHVTEVNDGISHKLDETRDNINTTRDSLSSSVSDSRDSLSSSLNDTRDSLDKSLTATRDGLSNSLNEARSALNAALDETKETMDASDRLEALAQRLEQALGRLDDMATRLDTVEDGFAARLGELGGTLEQSLTKVQGTLAGQPDTSAVTSLVKKSNEETERRIGGHLDEAMATFAELMMGGGPAMPTAPPSTLPRQQRRARGSKKVNGEKPRLEELEEAETGDDS
jgi:chromosome segregation ATPase